MGYVEDNLTSGEKVVMKTRLHWMVFFWPAFFTALGFWFILAAIAAKVEDGAGPGMFLLIFIGLPSLLLTHFNRRNSEFAITTKRVLMKEGFIRRKTLELMLQKVESLGVEQGILARVLGYGTITVAGSGGTKARFAKIDKAMEFRKQTQEQLPE